MYSKVHFVQHYEYSTWTFIYSESMLYMPIKHRVSLEYSVGPLYLAKVLRCRLQSHTSIFLLMIYVLFLCPSEVSTKTSLCSPKCPQIS